jgi:hypothetical protein
MKRSPGISYNAFEYTDTSDDMLSETSLYTADGRNNFFRKVGTLVTH